MSPFIGDDRSINAAAHMQMEKSGGTWAVYQLAELGHPEMGHMKFLSVGENCTYQTPPDVLPDTQTEINWRYVHVGWVDLKTGLVVDKLEEKT